MFTTPWMTAQADRRAAGRKRAWILTSSLLLHGMALATLSGFEVWQVPAVAEPPIADVFVVQLPLPVLPAAAPRRESKADSPKPKAETSKAAVTPAPLVPAVPAPVQPHRIPERLVPPADPPAADPPPGPTGPGRSGTGPYGNGNGDGDGTGTGDRGDRSQEDGPLPIGGPISRPQIIPGTRVEPRYTEPARLAHVQGVVILRAVIDERGNVIDVRVEKALPFRLDEEAVKAVSQWRFTPGLLNGRPVKVYFDLTVKFEIR